MPKPVWTDEMDATLQRMLGEGSSYTDVQHALGLVSRSSAAGRAFRLDIKVNRAGPMHRKPVPPKPRPPKPKLPKVIVAKPQKPKRINFKGSITLKRLEKEHCRFPLGEPGRYRYCGKKKLKGVAYCAEHAKLCFHPKFHTERMKAA